MSGMAVHGMAAQDPVASVSALHSAEDDIEALVDAIEQASFLDSVPGEDRQKLRAARTRLRKLVADAAAKSQAAGPQAERSAFARASYSIEEFEPLAAAYEGLKWRMISKPGGATVKPDDFYRLYGLHMQAVAGDNTADRPMWGEKGGLDFEGRARWDAWTAVKGVDASKAKQRFVKLFWEFPHKCLYSETRGALAPTADNDRA